jgi:hypothetical protein
MANQPGAYIISVPSVAVASERREGEGSIATGKGRREF